MPEQIERQWNHSEVTERIGYQVEPGRKPELREITQGTGEVVETSIHDRCECFPITQTFTN